MSSTCKRISFVIPAHNEERWLPSCLESVRESMNGISESYEIIVVNDASTDSTSAIAQSKADRHLTVNLRNIGAVRNAGAREACGEVLFFVDADTRVNEGAVRAALSCLAGGAVGGGCVPDLEGHVPFWARIVHAAACIAGRLLRLVGGCFLFCTREAYDAIGGFQESLHAGEDIAFVRSLKRRGKFRVPKPTVITSPRKLDVTKPWEVIGLLCWIAIRGPHYQSSWVIDLLYGRRAEASRRSDVSNAVK